MSKPNTIVYFVEGETERKLIEVLKTDLQLIVPGKVRMLNPVEYRITRRDLLQYGNKTMLVFLMVFISLVMVENRDIIRLSFVMMHI